MDHSIFSTRAQAHVFMFTQNLESVAIGWSIQSWGNSFQHREALAMLSEGGGSHDISPALALALVGFGSFPSLVAYPSPSSTMPYLSPITQLKMYICGQEPGRPERQEKAWKVSQEAEKGGREQRLRDLFPLAALPSSSYRAPSPVSFVIRHYFPRSLLVSFPFRGYWWLADFPSVTNRLYTFSVSSSQITSESHSRTTEPRHSVLTPLWQSAFILTGVWVPNNLSFCELTNPSKFSPAATYSLAK